MDFLEDESAVIRETALRDIGRGQGNLSKGFDGICV